MRKIILAAAALAGLAAFAAPAAASAATAPTTVKVVVHSAQHPDTTNICGVNDPDCVWAYDNLSMQLAATDKGNGTWTVNVTDNGSFAGFVDPVSGNLLTSNGPMQGTYQLTVSSDHAPNNANLPSQMSGVGTGAIVAQWFGVDPSAITGGSYNFSYQNGGYLQSSAAPYITGSIRGH
jgi:hypothetical protein